MDLDYLIEGKVKRVVNKDGISLFDDQVDVFNSIWEWLDKSEDLFYVLTGPGGAGKTFVLKALLEEYLRKEARVAVLAPIHKVLANIKKDFGFLTCKTIHSALGLQLNLSLPDFDVTNPSFFMNKEAEIITSYDLIIIDECSMINDKLCAYLEELAESSKTKILFVGDKSQTKPIKQETYSKVFSYKNNSSLSLIRRTNVDIIKEISSEVRNKTFNINNYSDLKFKRTEFINFKDLREYTVLAYTNKQVSLWNQAIKSKINPSEDPLAVGDKVLFYTSLSEWEPGIGSISLFKNGDTLTISGIKKDNKKYMVEFKENDNYIWINNDEESFVKEYEKLITIAKNKKDNKERALAWGEYYRWKKNNFIVKDIKTSVGVAKKDIDLGYAITSHKAIGSTLKKVAVDIGNIKTLRNRGRHSEYWELLYVAVSRAKENLIFV